ncbi:aldo/keto reductase [Nonomuraea terrae]|uniref:aldo/keto reductase n=1 Tax=Nonomuraea terrae TaxID=2530383 RepID=UPI00379AC5AA
MGGRDPLLRHLAALRDRTLRTPDRRVLAPGAARAVRPVHRRRPAAAPAGPGRPDGRVLPGARDPPAGWDFSRDGIRRSVEDSLTRLGVDRIDLLFLHDAEEHVEAALRDGYPALAGGFHLRLRCSGHTTPRT